MLLSAAQHKDFAKIKTALARGETVDQRDAGGYTALLYVCGHSYGIAPNAEIAQFLIKQGAEVDVKAKRDFTPLTQACSYGSYAVAKLLLEAGANPNLKGEYDMSPIVCAAGSAHWSQEGGRIIQLLLEYGAEVNATDRYQYNALLRCLEATPFNFETAKVLVEAGIDLNYVGNYHQTAIKAATQKGLLEMVKLLVAHGVDLNRKDQRGETPLVIAMMKNQLPVVRWMLEQGADPRVQAKYGFGLMEYVG